MNKPRMLGVTLAVACASLLALTTDQIIQKVYDSSNTAFRVNVVAGGGGGVPAGCSVALGVLTCSGFVSNAAANSPSFSTPNFTFEETPSGAVQTLALYNADDSHGWDWFYVTGTPGNKNTAGADLFSTATNYMEFECVNHNSGFPDNTCAISDLTTGSAGFYLYGNGPIIMQPGGATGLTLTSGQVATFAKGATFGTASGTTGSVGLVGTTSGTVTIKPQDAAGTYNFNLPTTAGTSGQVLTSGGGGSSAMTWGTAAKQVFGFKSSANAPSGTQYYPLGPPGGAGIAPTGTESSAFNGVFPVGGTAKNLICTGLVAQVSTNAEAFTVRISAVDTALTCTLNSSQSHTGLCATWSGGSADGFCCSDTTHTATITAGDYGTIKAVATNTPQNTTYYCTLEVDY